MTACNNIRFKDFFESIMPYQTDSFVLEAGTMWTDAPIKTIDSFLCHTMTRCNIVIDNTKYMLNQVDCAHYWYYTKIDESSSIGRFYSELDSVTIMRMFLDHCSRAEVT